MRSRKEIAKRGLKWLGKALEGEEGARKDKLVAWLEGELRGMGLGQVVVVPHQDKVYPEPEPGRILVECAISQTESASADAEPASVTVGSVSAVAEPEAAAAPAENPVVDVYVEGYAMNPKFMVGRLYEEEGGQVYRRVLLWRSRGRNLRPGTRVKCRLERGGGNPIYAAV